MSTRAPDPAMPGPTGRLPLRPTAFAVLAALSAAPRAGFDILERANENLPGRPILGPGTLYRLLRELRQEGLIARVDPPAGERGEDERRQYHALTVVGRALLEAEAARLRRTLAGAGLLDLRPDRP